ncbi:hypothetical protein IP88_04600 [alpha proteobacterium AAP81b]|nr:hypothetical protein IP88_04600 [alpha proteobacterium AAP81b]
MAQGAPIGKADGNVEAAPAPSVADFLSAFWTVGVLSFGGPAGQIATMHRELIDKRRWFEEAEFLGALNFCMLLPGPEAQQLATWCGWRLRGAWGGIAAGLLFLLPGAAVMAALVAIYLAFGRLAPVQALFGGVQAAVVAVVAQALLRVAGKALKTRLAWGLAGLAFVLLVGFGLPFPLVVALAAAIGAWRGREAPKAAPALARHPPWSRTAGVLAAGSALWLAPLGALAAWLGPAHELVDLGNFFAQLATASFGGAYAGLAYVAQGAAAAHGWVTPAEIVDGLALAETTPGPLVLTYQFVGGLAGHRIAGPWGPGAGAAIGMALVLWLTFVPSFVLVLGLAPQFDRLLAAPLLARALAGVTAAVVGVVASLGLWFALHVLFARVTTEAIGPLTLWVPHGAPDLFAAAIALAASLLLRRGSPMAAVLALAALAGVLRWIMNPG